MKKPLYVVHWLLAGRAVCGIEGVPDGWPPNHRWVGPATGRIENVTCGKCQKWLSEHEPGTPH